jgi:hypothetical protein
MADGVTTVAESIISTSHDVTPTSITCQLSTLPPTTSADVQMADGVATVAEQDVLDMVLQPGVMHDIIYNSQQLRYSLYHSLARWRTMFMSNMASLA